MVQRQAVYPKLENHDNKHGFFMGLSPIKESIKHHPGPVFGPRGDVEKAIVAPSDVAGIVAPIGGSPGNKCNPCLRGHPTGVGIAAAAGGPGRTSDL